MSAPFSHTLNQIEIAAVLGVSVMTVQRLIKRKRIPYIVIGRRKKFSAEEVAAYMRENNAAPTRKAA